MKTWAMGLAALLMLAGCGGIGSSALNPANWFGRSNDDQVLPENTVVVRDTRPLIEEITVLAVEKVEGGAIVRARGAAATAGWFNASLLTEPERSGNGVLVMSFRASQPEFPSQGQGSARLITAATFLGSSELAGVRSVQVLSRTNVRAAQP
ncbi:MAG: hypothetical protein AAGO57_07765 [Pseudomonadota bacterium]